MTLTILVAPSGFKESLSVDDVTRAIGDSIRRATGGRIILTCVTGPVGDPVDSFFGLMGGPGPRTAVIDIAAAAGLSLVPRDQRNPMLTTSFGVGQLILAALNAGVDRILIGCGDSGINDGGAGLAPALGVRLLDDNDAEIGPGCGKVVLVAPHRYNGA